MRAGPGVVSEETFMQICRSQHSQHSPGDASLIADLEEAIILIIYLQRDIAIAQCTTLQLDHLVVT